MTFHDTNPSTSSRQTHSSIEDVILDSRDKIMQQNFLPSFFFLFLNFIFLLFDAAERRICIIWNIVSSYLIIVVRSRFVKNTKNYFSFPPDRYSFREESICNKINATFAIAKTMITITGFDRLSILSLLAGSSSIIYDFVYSPSTDRIAVKHGVMHIEDVVRGLKKRDREMHSTSLSHSIDIFLFFFFLLP